MMEKILKDSHLTETFLVKNLVLSKYIREGFDS